MGAGPIDNIKLYYQTAREQYVEGQEALRREIERKKLEKETGKLIDEMLWGVPRGRESCESHA